MGEVWRGYDTRADWVVAVKVLGARAAGAATREVLKQHAQAVARVIHPNVAMVLDVGDEDGAPFLVTEFLTGTSLGEDLAATGPLKIIEVCDLIGQAAAGLDAAHRAGVFHGQIDPGSFRRAASGVLKVVGFGLADEEPSQAERRYLAPERASGGPASAASDLYALGAVCYELLCGRPPTPTAPAPTAPTSTAPASEAPATEAPDLPVTGARLSPPPSPDAPKASADASPTGPEASPAPAEAAGGRGGTILPPSKLRPEVPAQLDRLVLAMLAADPAERPSGGESIRRALAAIARPAALPGASPTATHAQPGAQPGVPAGRPGDTEVHAFNVVPRAGDTAVYDAADLAPAPSRNNKLLLQMGIAVAVIAAVTVGMVLWTGSREEIPLATSTPSPTPTAALGLPTEPVTTPTPVVSPSTGLQPGDTPTRLVETVVPKATLGGGQEPQGGWDHWLVMFDQALTAQEQVGDINPEVAEKAHDKLRKAARKLQQGHLEPARNQIRGVYDDLRRAQEHGDAPGSGPLAAFMNDFALS
ncbi:MAG: protein kinase [Nonomuraea sp.]|nr:protein kinase [Nonomuraea sp.]